MGNQSACCSCTQDATQKDKQIDYDKNQIIQAPATRDQHQLASKRSEGKSSNRLNNSQHAYSINNHDQSRLNNIEQQSFGHKQSKVQVNVSAPQSNVNVNNNGSLMMEIRGDKSRTPALKSSIAIVNNLDQQLADNQSERQAQGVGPGQKPLQNNQLGQGESQMDVIGNSKYKSETLAGQGLKNVGPSNLNLRFVDNQWLSSFKIVKYLKREIFSDVFLIKMSTPQLIGETRVLRKIKKVIFSDSPSAVDEYRLSLEELLQVEHPCIAQTFDFKEDQYNFYIIVEFCPGGKLFSKIEQLTEMTENLAAEICRQILSTQICIHAKNIVYRNLNPDALLLETDENIVDGFNLKLVNLDVYAAFTVANPYYNVMPLYFQSPESLKTKKFTEKLDVWSAGIILAVLLTGVPPQQIVESSFQLVNLIIQGSFDFESNHWREISPNAVELIRKMLDLDDEKRIKAVTAHNDKWLLNITKAKRNNQRKILNSTVINHLKTFIAEWRFYKSISDFFSQLRLNPVEEKYLIEFFQTKDPQNHGDLKMDQIRDAYSEYCGRFIERDEIDSILESCTVQVSRGGSIKYSQFVLVKSKKAIEFHKQRIKQKFSVYEQRRSMVQHEGPYKQGSLHKKEVKKMLGAILTSNNDQSESFLKDFDKDQDGFLSIDEVIGMIATVANHI